MRVSEIRVKRIRVNRGLGSKQPNSLQTTQKISEDCLQKHELNHNVVFLNQIIIMLNIF